MSEPDAADGLPAPRRYVAAAAVLAAVVLAVLDGAIANIALPTLSRELGASPAATVWVVTGYQIALVVALLPFAALGESIGYRRVFMAGVVAFTAASGLCALAPGLIALVGARVVQGLGAAAIMSMLAALLRHTYPVGSLGKAIGLNAVFVGLASAVGPTLGAGILSVAGWPWLFAVNIPVGLVVLAAGTALPRVPPSHRHVDLVSVALNAALFGPLVAGVDLLANRPGAGVALLAVAAVAAVLLVRREAPRPAPLIPLDLLRGPAFRLSVIASVCLFTGQTLALIALPFYLQHGLGLDPVTTGLLMTPWPLALMVAAPIAGRLADKATTASLCVGGGIVFAVGLTLAATWPLGRDVRPLVGFMVLCGLGFGFFQTPNNRNMLLAAPRARSGAAGGTQATARQFGQSCGSVLTALLLTMAPAQAPRIALGVAACFAVAAALVSALRMERGPPG